MGWAWMFGRPGYTRIGPAVPYAGSGGPWCGTFLLRSDLEGVPYTLVETATRSPEAHTATPGWDGHRGGARFDLHGRNKTGGRS